MKIWWCQEHDTFSQRELCPWVGTWNPEPCQLVSMRLIPDVETVESKPKCSACAFEDHEEHWDYGIRR